MENPTMSPHLPLHRIAHVVLPVLLAIAAGLWTSEPQAQGKGEASKFYEDALVRYEQKDLPGTIIQLKNALKIDPAMLPVQLLLGKALMQNGEVAAAEVALKEALRLGVDRAEVVVLLARSYAIQGKQRAMLDQATFNPAGLPAPIQLQLILLRATAQSDLGETRNALRSLDEARALDSKSPAVPLTEVPIRIRFGQFKEALEAADRAAMLAPASIEVEYQKASILHAKGDLPGAIATYGRVLAADPRNVEARVARIGIYLDQDDYAGAGKDLDELRRLTPRDPRGAYLRALMAERQGNGTEANAALKEVTDLLDPIPLDYILYRPQLLMLNGLAHYGLNQGEKAKVYLEVFMKVQRNSPAAKLLARLYMSQGNPAEAISVLENYLRAQPGDGQAMTMLARAHMTVGRNAKAAALMQEAIKKRDNPAFHTTLGLSLLRRGQAEDGILELEAAYKKDPRQVQAASALIQTYLGIGQSRKAVPVAEGLVKQEPGNAHFHNLLGMALGQAGKVAPAKAAFDKALQLDGGMTAAKLNMARLEIAGRSLDEATARLDDILKSDPNNGEAMFELAVIADRKGRQADAQRWLEKARDKAGPRELRWGIALVDFHLRYGRPSAALDAAKLVLAKGSEDVSSLLSYARAQLASGDTVGTKSTLSNATRFAEYDPSKLVEIARLQMLANHPEGASYSLEKALSNNTDYLPAQTLMVAATLAKGEAQAAEKLAREIVSKYPRMAIGYSLLGDIALTKGQTAASVDAYRKAHQVEPTTDSILRLMRSMAGQDGGKSALVAGEQWLKAHPKDLMVHKAVADATARTGNFKAARIAYEAALKVKPDDSELLNNLANVQLRLKDPAAVKTAEAALAHAPGNAMATDTLGWALFQNGQTERALQLLRDARLRLPGNPEIRFHLAVVLAKLGRGSEAREELRAALDSGTAFESLSDAKDLLASLR